MELRNELKKIKIDLAAYYAADFTGHQEDSRQNRALRSRMREVILGAYKVQDLELMNDALDVLSKSTGCAEDYSIFVDITDELIAKNIIAKDKFRELLHGSPSNRWL